MGAVRNRSGEYGALKNAAIAAMKRKNDKKRERAEITEELINGTYAYPKYLIDHPDVADRIEQSIRDNMWKLQGKNAKPPASAAAKPVSVSADDFNDD